MTLSKLFVGILWVGLMLAAAYIQYRPVIHTGYDVLNGILVHQSK